MPKTIKHDSEIPDLIRRTRRLPVPLRDIVVHNIRLMLGLAEKQAAEAPRVSGSSATLVERPPADLG